MGIPFPGGCKEGFDAAEANLNSGLSTRISDILRDIGAKLHAGARIVYLGYPSLVKTGDHADWDTCLGTHCAVSGADIISAEGELVALQSAAVQDANSDPTMVAKDVSVVPVLDVETSFSGLEPYAGSKSDSNALLWDPIPDSVGGWPPPIPYFLHLPECRKLKLSDPMKAFDTCSSAFKSGFFHPKAEGYAHELDLMDRHGSAFQFGVSAGSGMYVSVDDLRARVNVPVSLVATDNLPGPKQYLWDFDGDGTFESSTGAGVVEHVYSSDWSGFAHVRVTYSGGSMDGWGQVIVTSDGDSIEIGDNCPYVANEDQADADADGIGDACDPDPWGLMDRLAGLWGDPHMVTLDGLNYDFQAAGEFHLLKDEAAGIDIQMRTAKAYGWASVWSALATRIDGHEVEVGSDLKVLVDGRLLEDPSMTFLDGSMVTRSADAVDIRDPHGAWVHATSMGVGVRVPPGTSPVGLLGDGDGSRSNDLRTASGEHVDPYDVRRIHERFADSWRVSDSDSLFTYASGQSTADFSDPTFPATVKTLADFSAADLEAAVEVETRWAARGVVDSSAGEFHRYCEQELVRCRQVVPAEVVFGEVSQHKWFMMLNVNTTFYTEPVGR